MKNKIKFGKLHNFCSIFSIKKSYKIKRGRKSLLHYFFWTILKGKQYYQNFANKTITTNRSKCSNGFGSKKFSMTLYQAKEGKHECDVRPAMYKNSKMINLLSRLLLK